MKRLSLLLIPLLTFANLAEEIANSLKMVSYETQLDARILYTIASIESGFNPYIISFVTEDKKLIKELENGFKNTNCNFNYGVLKKDRYIASISSSNKELMIKIADFFWDMNFNIDFGLMQISKQNLKREEIKYIFNPLYNIKKSTIMLYECYKNYSDIKNMIECYNRGFVAKKTFNYYIKFENNYNKFFGDKK